MSSKIEAAHLKLGDLLNDLQGQYPSARIEEIQKLLDTPVVERQPSVHRVIFNDGQRSGWFDGPPARIDIDDVADKVIAGLELAYTSLPELAELQATIARLTAENEVLNDVNSKHWKVICDQNDEIKRLQEAHQQVCTNYNKVSHASEERGKEIERLKAGQGEPVATVSVWHIDQWYASDPSKAGRNVGIKFVVDTDSLLDGQPLYASQPAPVSAELVRLLTRARVYARGEFRDEIDACLSGQPAQVSVVEFANELIDGAFEGGNFGGDDIQDIAVKYGLLRIENRTEECGKVCACSEYGFPAKCYRKNACLSGQPAPVSVVLDERAEFITWVRREWPQAPLSNVRDLLPRDDPRYGEYCDETLQRAWVGWQARACLDKVKELNQ